MLYIQLGQKIDWGQNITRRIRFGSKLNLIPKNCVHIIQEEKNLVEYTLNTSQIPFGYFFGT